MSTSKHPKHPPQSKDDLGADVPKLQDDLERNPGIGQSKGAFATGQDPMDAEGDNTVEGDVENDPGGLGGAVDPERLGRENK